MSLTAGPPVSPRLAMGGAIVGEDGDVRRPLQYAESIDQAAGLARRDRQRGRRGRRLPRPRGRHPNRPGHQAAKRPAALASYSSRIARGRSFSYDWLEGGQPSRADGREPSRTRIEARLDQVSDDFVDLRRGTLADPARGVSLEMKELGRYAPRRVARRKADGLRAGARWNCRGVTKSLTNEPARFSLRAGSRLGDVRPLRGARGRVFCKFSR